MGVFLAYGSAHGTAFIDRALYLPKTWTTDAGRCAAAGVPRTVGFATKVALAKRLLDRAFAAAVPARWVVADNFYGRAQHFRQWLEQRGRSHVVGILPAQVVVHDGQRQRAKALATRVPSEAWICRSSGTGSQGERVQEWVCLALTEAAAPGMARWLLVRRPLEHPDDCAYFRAYGPVDTPVAELVRIAGVRWSIEQDHRGIKHRYYPTRGFESMESASCFCRAFDEQLQFFRVRRTMCARVPPLAEQ